jgi:hypothetical protein
MASSIGKISERVVKNPDQYVFQLNRVQEGDADLSMTVPSRSANPPRGFPVPAFAQVGVHCYVKSFVSLDLILEDSVRIISRLASSKAR